MYAGKTLFAHLMDFLPWSTFARLVERYRGEHRVRTFTCAEQYRAMAFAQLTYRESLRDIEICLSAQAAKLYHMGFREPVRRSTLSDANEARDWRIWAQLAQRLIAQARAPPNAATAPGATSSTPSMTCQPASINSTHSSMPSSIDTTPTDPMEPWRKNTRPVPSCPLSQGGSRLSYVLIADNGLRKLAFVTIIGVETCASGCSGRTPGEAMQRPDERELREQLSRLRAEHRDLDAEIAAEESLPFCDQLQIKRLKKKKLLLKDQITSIEDQLLPDIIA